MTRLLSTRLSATTATCALVLAAVIAAGGPAFAKNEKEKPDKGGGTETEQTGGAEPEQTGGTETEQTGGTESSQSSEPASSSSESTPEPSSTDGTGGEKQSKEDKDAEKAAKDAEKEAEKAAKEAEKAEKEVEKASNTASEEPLEILTVQSVPSIQTIDPEDQKKAEKELAKALKDQAKAQTKLEKEATKEAKRLAKLQGAAPQPQPTVLGPFRRLFTPRASLAETVADNRGDEPVCGYYEVNGVLMYSTWRNAYSAPASFKATPCKTIN